MKINIKQNKVFYSILIYLLLSITILLGIDYSSKVTINNIKMIKLKNHSETGLGHITLETENLNNKIQKIQKRITINKEVRYPNLQEFKDLSKKYYLKLTKMERINVLEKSGSKLSKYTTIFQGRITNIVRFLNKLENNYIFSSDNLILQSSDEKGETVYLNLSLLIGSNER